MFSANKDKLTQGGVIKKLRQSVTPLIAAIKAENMLLENGKLSQLEEACEKKVQCLQSLNEAEASLEDFIQHNHLDKADPALAKLKEVFLDLSLVNERNDILLRANIEASSKIMEFYKEAHKSKITKNYGYNSQGTIAVSKNLEKIMPSISLNNKV